MNTHFVKFKTTIQITKNKITDYAKKKKYGRSDGSLTVEAALTLPILLLLLTTLLIWLQFFRVQEESMRKVNAHLRQISDYSTMVSGAVEVIPGVGNTAWNELMPEQLWYADLSVLKFPVVFVSEEKTFLRQAMLRRFTGRRYKTNTTGEEQKAEFVYLAETGRVYHIRETCTHLCLSTQSVKYGMLEHLRNQNGAKYYPCEFCGKGKNYTVQSTVYITKEGNRYHSDSRCHGLLRKVHKATLEEAVAEGRTPCKRCSGGEK